MLQGTIAEESTASNNMHEGISLPAYRGLLRTLGCEHRSSSASTLGIPS